MTALVNSLRSRLATAPRRSRVGPVGLHFAEDQVHAVQLRRMASGKFCLRAWASLEYFDTRDDALASPARLRRLLDQLFSRAPFKGRKLVTALPPAMARIHSLNYQVSGGASDGEIILQLVAERLGGDIEDYVVDYLPVRGDSNRDRVALVAVSRRDTVLNFLDNLHRARCEVLELEVGPAAINRLVGLLPKPQGAHGNVLVINYGDQRSYLTLISGRRLLMDREVDFGASRVLEQVSRSLEIPLDMASKMIVRQGLSQQLGRPFGATQVLTADDLNPIVEIVRPVFARLVEEVRRACLYTAAESQGEVIEQIYTFGSIARWPGADELLAEMARLPVASSLPLTAVLDGGAQQDDPRYEGIGPDLVVATGLALRGLADNG